MCVCGFLCVQVLQEEFSHTVLHQNRAAASQAIKTRAGAAGKVADHKKQHHNRSDRNRARLS